MAQNFFWVQITEKGQASIVKFIVESGISYRKNPALG